MSGDSTSTASVWLRPLSHLLVIATVFIFVPALCDALFIGDHKTDLSWLQNLPEVFAGVIGIALTVVAIIVELAANRYTARITELFFRARINSVIMSYFVVSCIQCVWVAFQSSDAIPWTPVVGTYTALSSVTLSLLLLLPYFIFVFNFLNPHNIVERLKEHTLAQIHQATTTRTAMESLKGDVIESIEQMADVALNAIQNKDKAIAMDSVDALRDLALGYLLLKPLLGDSWFDVSQRVRLSPDFVSMTPDTHDDLRQRKLWLEMKIFRQYEMLFGEALNRTRDINYLIATNARQVGERLLTDEDFQAHQLVVRFFNTFMRQTINGRDVRTAYNLLNQYRLLAEHALRQGRGGEVERIAFYFKHYGQLAFAQGLPFILETVAYDLCALNELAYDLDAPNKEILLDDFLEVDKESEEPHEHEATLRGVRKAQIKLATYYLVHDAPKLARTVWRDMQEEVPDRLKSIKLELLQITTKEYWEIIDRGTNFDYLEPARREKLEEFFSWLGERVR